MTSTVFVNQVTPVVASWLNDINNHVYTNTPISPAITVHPASAVGYTPAGTGAVATTVQGKLRETVSVFDFMTTAQVADVQANTLTLDVTAAIQACWLYCSSNGRTALHPAGLYKITSQLTWQGTGVNGVGGIVFEDGAGLRPSGSGYTATLIKGDLSCCTINLNGNGNTLNGIQFGESTAANDSKNIRSSLLNKVSVSSCDGFGVAILGAYDCSFDYISVVSCGNTANYAFSVQDGGAGNTTNMCLFGHLQVELSTAKAISISANTFACTFNQIHSERATGNISYTTWLLGGFLCTYNNVRLTTSGTASNASAFLQGASLTYVNFRAETAFPVTYNGSVTPFILITPYIAGSFAATAGNNQPMTMISGNIGSITGDSTIVDAYKVVVTTLTLGNVASEPSKMVFTNCSITTLDGTTAGSACALYHSTVAAVTLMPDYLIAHDSSITNSGTTQLSYKKVEFYNTIFTGSINVTQTGGVPLYFDGASSITGALTLNGGSTSAAIFGDGFTVGSQSGFNTAPYSTSLWKPGKRCWNIVPIGGAPKSWVLTTTPAWASEGNL